MELSVVLPCYNEAENIEHTIREVASWFRTSNIDGEIIVVDDGSVDGSGALADALRKDVPHLMVIRHAKNMGVGVAQSDGCDRGTKKYVGYMDSDGQFKAEDIELLLPKLADHRIVAGYRKKRADPFVRTLNAWLYGWLVRSMLGVRKRDVNCGLVLFEKELWPSIRPAYASGGLFPAEMYLNVQRLGETIAEVAVPHYPRRAGAQTGANPLVIFRMFKELRLLRRALRKQRN